MPITDMTKIHWACRRGMKELDLLIMPFFEQHYSRLSTSQQQAFIQLLTYQDPQLFRWLMNQSQPDDSELLSIVRLIQQQR